MFCLIPDTCLSGRRIGRQKKKFKKDAEKDVLVCSCVSVSDVSGLSWVRLEWVKGGSRGACPPGKNPHSAVLLPLSAKVPEPGVGYQYSQDLL